MKIIIPRLWSASWGTSSSPLVASWGPVGLSRGDRLGALEGCLTALLNRLGVLQETLGGLVWTPGELGRCTGELVDPPAPPATPLKRDFGPGGRGKGGGGSKTSHTPFHLRQAKVGGFLCGYIDGVRPGIHPNQGANCNYGYHGARVSLVFRSTRAAR